MIRVAITGANGQLGRCLHVVFDLNKQIKATFVSKEQLDVTDENAVSAFFRNYSFDYCVNTAAYTNVEKAESEKAKAFAINAQGAKNIAVACEENSITLLQISTDYVFDGKKETPYVENDKTNPINVYGASKLKGEQEVAQNCSAYFIIRTSWLYSQYGHNFYKTILRNAALGKNLTITTEQTGTPTNANDLAAFVETVITSNSNQYGIYHYSNEGSGTWYDFAEEILKATRQLETIHLAKTNEYPTFAARPKYSVLSKKHSIALFNIFLESWKFSLGQLIKNNKPI